MATSNLSLTRLTLQALAPCFFLSVSQSSDVSKRGMGGFLEPELWPGSEAWGRRRKQTRLLSFSVFSQPVFQPLPLLCPKAPSLTGLAQGYSCVRLGSTALSSGLDNGHGHLWGKDSPSFWLRLKRKKEVGPMCFFTVFATGKKNSEDSP